MATALSPDRLLTALRAEGLTVREYKSWRTHNRDDETGKAFGPVHGIVIHHTAGRDSLALCYNGTTGLPGPLCHTHLAKDGIASMLSAGRANHAGTFAANAHQAVLDEAPTHPRPDAAEPIDANDCYYGIEIENLGDGKDPYPSVQYDAAVRWAAAICRAHGWTENSVIGHKEGTRRKIDPSFSMFTFRTDVAERLKHPADWTPGGTTPSEEDDVALTDADIKKIAAVVRDEIFGADVIAAVAPPYNNADWDDGNRTWTFKYAVHTPIVTGRETLARVKDIQDKVGTVDMTDQQIAALASAVASNPALAEQIAEKVAVKLAERLAD